MTDRRGQAGGAILVLALISALCLSGCKTRSPLPPVVHHVADPFTIIVASPGRIQELWQEASDGDSRKVDGFYSPPARTIYVKYNINDRSQPDFQALGHELWHLPELGGDFHE